MEEKSVCNIDIYGDKFWRLNGKLHREDGPAIEYPNGHKFWYLNGKATGCNNQEEFEYYLKYKAFM